MPAMPTQQDNINAADVFPCHIACSLRPHSFIYASSSPSRLRSLDTGRLNPETYRVFDAVEKHYGIHIEYTFPDADETKELVRAKGMFSFYEDGHQECCRVRKVGRHPAPLPCLAPLPCRCRLMAEHGDDAAADAEYQALRPPSHGKPPADGTNGRPVAAGAAAQEAAEGPQGLDHRAAQGPEPRHARGSPRGAGQLPPEWLLPQSGIV